MAAQVGVAPLSLFYFHQFPGLFFLSNLIIIPILGLILGSGLLVIFLTLINALPTFIAKLFGGIIDRLNDFVGWVAKQEAFIFKGIPFDLLDVVLTYLIIVLGIRLFQERSFNRIVPCLLTILIIQSVSIYDRSRTSNSFIVFHKSRYSILGFQNADMLKAFHNLDSMGLKKDNTISTHTIGEGLSYSSSDGLSSVYKVDDSLLLIVDSLAIYDVDFNPDMILLRNSPKINLDRLIDHLEPKLIIADGSNYKSYVARWEETCFNKKLPFHATAKKGAFIIEYAK